MVQQKFYYSICSEITVAGWPENLKHKPQSSGRLPHVLGIYKEE